MQLEAILSAALGLSSPWHLIEAVVSADRTRLDITISYARPDSVASDDSETNVNVLWFNSCFLNYETYLHLQGPQPDSTQDELDLKPPWTRAGSNFVKIQETSASMDDRSHHPN